MVSPETSGSTIAQGARRVPLYDDAKWEEPTLSSLSGGLPFDYRKDAVHYGRTPPEDFNSRNQGCSRRVVKNHQEPSDEAAALAKLSA